MKIVESFLKGKRAVQSLCEDNFVVTDYFAAVVDGSTGKGTMRYMEESTGHAASAAIINAVSTMLSPDSSISDAIGLFTEIIGHKYDELGVRDMVGKCPENRITASAVIYSSRRQEIWMIGDCQCLVDGLLHTNCKKIDSVLSETRALYIQLMQPDFYSKYIDCAESTLKFDASEMDLGREYILPLLRKQCALQNAAQNVEYAYGVIDGIGSPLLFSKVIDVRESSDLVLATDGYPVLYPTLEESEKALAELLRADPMMIYKFKSTKGMTKGLLSFDDRAYLRVKLD